MKLQNYYSYKTKRLNVIDVNKLLKTLTNESDFYENVVNIMSSDVTKDLPEGWQAINTRDKAYKWLQTMQKESKFYLVKQNKNIIGFLFLYETPLENKKIELRIGYLLAKESWGNGYATELIQGLLQHCKSGMIIETILAGVSKDNQSSIRVLEKCGFNRAESPDSDSLMYEYLYK